jgi:hypothetical protein
MLRSGAGSTQPTEKRNHERAYRAFGVRLLGGRRDRFVDDYQRLLRAIEENCLHAAVCTIYNPCASDELFQREAVMALGIFNDCISNAARKFRCPVIELRAVCTEAADYSNEIERSSVGGAKIAGAIRQVLDDGFGGHRSVLYPAGQEAQS